MRAVFLDRDGTIARDVNYCRRTEDFELLPGVPEAIGLLNRNDFKVVVVTNQSGIARGYFTEGTLTLIHRYMNEELTRRGARIDAIYYCPHHPDEGCACRKPKPTLMVQAAADLGISLLGSYMVGDSLKDVEAGKAAGCHTVLLGNGAKDFKDSTAITPDHIAADLREAVKWILGN